MNFFKRNKLGTEFAFTKAGLVLDKKIVFLLGFVFVVAGFFVLSQKAKAAFETGQPAPIVNGATSIVREFNLKSRGVSDDKLSTLSELTAGVSVGVGLTFTTEDNSFINVPIELPSADQTENTQTKDHYYTIFSNDGKGNINFIVKTSGGDGIPDAVSEKEDDRTVRAGTIDITTGNVIDQTFDSVTAQSIDPQVQENAINKFYKSYVYGSTATSDSITEQAYKEQYGINNSAAELATKNKQIDEELTSLETRLQNADEEEKQDIQDQIDALNAQKSFNSGQIASAKDTGVAQSNANKGTAETGNGECIKWDATIYFGNCMAQLAYYILYILSNIVGFVGNLLNTVMEWTVVSMSANISGISAINSGWTAIRDLVNIFFIFILLYIAISTILGIDEHGAKHALAKVIIFGVLINFSMFFTKVIIDASNIFTLQFYTKITQQENGGMGTALMGAFKITSIFNASSADSHDAAKTFAGNTQNSGTVFVMGLIMIMVAISVLLGATWIFLKRFVVFVFLLISSPLAFAGMILHSTEHYAKMWWQALMAEVIATPAVMIMLWLAFTIMETGIYTVTATATSGGLANELGMITISNSGSRVGIIFNFAIITMLLSFCLVVAQKLGASGGAGAVKIGNWTRGAMAAGTFGLAGFGVRKAWDNTVGARLHSFKNKGQTSEDLAARMAGYKDASRKEKLGIIGTKIARLQGFAADKLSSGYKKSLDSDIKYQENLDHEVHGDVESTAGQFINAQAQSKIGRRLQGEYGDGVKMSDARFDKMSTEEHANLKYSLEESKANGEKEAAKPPKEQNKKVVESGRLAGLALNRYYTDPHHARIGTKALDVQRFSQEKLLSEQKRIMDLELFDENLAKLSDAKKLESLSNAKNRFAKMTEKQKAEYVSSLSTDDQKKLFTENNVISEGFRDALKEQFKTFTMVEQAVRGSNPTDELKEFFSKEVAGQAIVRKKLYELITSKDFAKMDDDDQTKIRDDFNSLIDKIPANLRVGATGSTLSAQELATLYKTHADSKGNKTFKGDQSFKESDNNYNRIMPENADVTRVNELIKSVKDTE